MTLPRHGRRDFMAWGALSALGAAGLGGCARSACPAKPPEGTWNNAVCSLDDITPKAMVYPETASDLVAAVKAAEASGRRVRMTGSGHSFSDVAVTDDTLLRPTRLNGVLKLDRGRLKPWAANDRHLVRVESGITFRELSPWLDSRGLALENLGGYDAQTVTGAIMTATHGSGLGFGPVSSQVVSLQVVVAGGAVLQVEPTRGITDPVRFVRSLEENPGLPLRLIQDDGLFRALVVSMGCMGLVYALVLRSVESYWIREERRLVRWDELTKTGGYLRELVRRPRDPGFPDHVEINVSPYPTSFGKRLCLLTRRWRYGTKPPPEGTSTNRGVLGSGNLFADARARALTEDTLIDLFDSADRPGLATLHAALLLALVDDNFTDKSYVVYNLGDINRFRAFGIEMAFPLEDTVRATEAMFEVAEAERRKGRHHSVPVTLRFVKAAEAFLAMQQGRDTMMMEIGMLVRARDSAELLRSYEEYFIREFAARPHWGLDLSVLRGHEQVASLYPFWREWLGAYGQLNASGVFDGRLTDRLDISVGGRAQGSATASTTGGAWG